MADLIDVLESTYSQDFSSPPEEWNLEAYEMKM